MADEVKNTPAPVLAPTPAPAPVKPVAVAPKAEAPPAPSVELQLIGVLTDQLAEVKAEIEKLKTRINAFNEKSGIKIY